MKHSTTREERRMDLLVHALDVYEYLPLAGEIINRKTGNTLVPNKERNILLYLNDGNLTGQQFAWFSVKKTDPNENGARIYVKDGDATNLRYDNLFRNIGPITERVPYANNANASSIGVSYSKTLDKWQAYFLIDGKLKNLGLFDTEAEAKAARVEAIKQWREENLIDFPTHITEEDL